MSDLISRQAAIDATWEEPMYADPLNVLTEVRDRLKALPSAQPEIIRCKDCRYYRWASDMCDYPYATAQNVVHEDDYCSKAERRTDE